MNKPDYTFGDLVKVNGYYPRIFEVECFREERWHYPDGSYDVVVYELTDCDTGEMLEAEQEDLSLVADAGQADEYLRANLINGEYASYWVSGKLMPREGANEMAKNERKPTARELSGIEADKRKKERKERAAQIDNLLDQRNWYAGMLAKSNDESYGDRVVAIDAELKKLTEKE